MTISEYEAMYTSVNTAKHSVRDIDKVVALLRNNPQRSWSVKDLRLAIYGDTEDKMSEANHIAQILHHLISRGRAQRVLVECEPIYTHLVRPMVDYDAQHDALVLRHEGWITPKVYFYQWCA